MDKMVRDAKAIPSSHYLVKPQVNLKENESAGLSSEDLDKIKAEAVRKAKKLAAEKRGEIDELMNEIIYA